MSRRDAKQHLAQGSGAAWVGAARHFTPRSCHREQRLESAQNHRTAQDAGPRRDGEDSQPPAQEGVGCETAGSCSLELQRMQQKRTPMKTSG